jgi:hypothetical protein
MVVTLAFGSVVPVPTCRVPRGKFKCKINQMIDLNRIKKEEPQDQLWHQSGNDIPWGGRKMK